MIYVRGQPEDYQRWEDEAGPEWGWPAMKEAFRAIEDHELGADELRGAGGPLHISTGKFRYPLSEAMVRAGQEMGLPVLEDFNREHQEGVGYYSHTIKDGRRVSAATAFLHPVLSRANLRVQTGARVERLFDRVDLRRGERPEALDRREETGGGQFAVDSKHGSRRTSGKRKPNPAAEPAASGIRCSRRRFVTILKG